MLQTIGFLDYNKTHMGNPCAKYITDIEFLKHMIPHHQVAVDMSKELLKYSSDPNIIYLARNIIYKQSDEILHMENTLLSGIPDISFNDQYKYIEIPNQFTVWYPLISRSKKYSCGLHHFDPSKLHNKHGVLTDEAYLKHMIPHHDVAIEMSNRIIKNSKNPAMVSFAYEIIKNQRYEIWLMRHYLKYSQKQQSNSFYNVFKLLFNI
jgi:uncharacterized protein (DUF305 family)